MSAVERTALDAMAAKSGIPGGSHAASAAANNAPSRRSTPLVQAGYAHRVQVLQSVVQQWSRPNGQWLILGAGLDRSGFEAAANDRVAVVEVDLPSVCQLKRESIPMDSMEQGVWKAPDRPFTLVEADLQEDRARVETCLQPNRPLLVVLEVVLAYIQNIDAVLEWCATLGGTLVCLEPLGSSGSNSVGDSYRRDYAQQFQSKLQRGGETAGFYPLGTSCTNVQQRLERAGFRRVVATTLGEAARYLPTPVELSGPLDEHAALALHLVSYVIAVASNESSEPISATLCPWITGFRPRPVGGKFDGGVLVRVLENGDEERVRDLFKSAYQHLFDEYAAVRRMVESALANELAGSGVEIAARYRRDRGIFLVAVDDGVVACFGLRKSLIRSRTLEIVRLVVDERSRHQGLATALLEAAVEFGRRTGNGFFEATTPAILEANGFYQAKGFNVDEEIQSGKLLMRTYRREIAK